MRLERILINIALIIGIATLTAALLGRTQHYLTAGMMLGLYIFYKIIESDTNDYD